MKAKTAILLAILLIIAIGFLAIRESDLLTPGEPGESPNGVLFEEAGFAPTRVILTDSTGETVTFRKIDGDWRITQPVGADAVDWKVEQLTALLDSLAYQRSIRPGDPQEISIEEAGLDEPVWTLTGQTDTGRKRTLRIGRPVPQIGTDEPRTYVQPEGEERIFVAGRSFADVLGRPAGEYRELKLLSVPVARVHSATIMGEQNFHLARGENGWSVSRGEVFARGDQGKIEDYLRKIARLQADAFVTQAENPSTFAMYGLANPRLTVSLTVAETAATQPADANTIKHSLAFSAPSQDRVFLRVGDANAIYQVGKSLLEDLQADWETLRSKRVLTITPDSVRAVTIRRDGQTTKVTQNNDGVWTMSSPYTGPASGTDVGQLLGDLADLAAVDWRDNPPSLAAMGLENPRTTVTMARTAAASPVTLEVGDVDGNEVYVRAAGSNSIAVVKRKGLAGLGKVPASLWNRDVFKLAPTERIETVRVDQPGRKDIPSYTVVRQPNGRWTLTDPVEAPADDETVQGMLHQAERIVARRTVALGEVPAEYGDANQHVKVTLGLKPSPAAAQSADVNDPAPRTITLHIVKVGEKGYVWREGVKPVAVRKVSAGLFIDFSEELRKRDLFPDMQQADVQRVEISGPDGNAVTLQRSEGQWQGRINGNDVAADKALSLVENLLAARAERFIAHKRVPAKRHGLDKPGWTFTVTPAGDGKPRTLRIAAEPTKGFDGLPASIDGVAGVFTLPSWRVEGLASAVGRLAKDE